MSLHVEKALRWLAPDLDWRAWQGVEGKEIPQSGGAVMMPKKHNDSARIPLVAPEIDDATGQLVLGKDDHLKWLNALGFLSHHFLTWGRSGLSLRDEPEVVLEAQRILGSIPFEPMMAFAWIVDIDRLANHGREKKNYRIWLRGLPQQELNRLFHREPLIPTPQWPELTRIKRQGLTEPHRHLNGSGLLPTYWLDILRYGQTILRKNKEFSLAELVAALRWLRRALQFRLRNTSWVWGELPEGKFDCTAFWKGLFRKRTLGFWPGGQALPVDPDVQWKEARGTKRDADLILERVFLCRLFDAAVRHPEDTWLHRYAHAYLAWQTLLWRKLVQARNDEVGFDRFNRKHGNELRYAGANHIVRRMVQAQRTGHVRKASWRMTAKDLFPKARAMDLLENADHYRSSPIPRGRVSVANYDANAHKLICHWIRKSTFQEREQARRKDLQKFRLFLNSRHAWRLEGIDIANSEFNGWSAEFAPMFQRIRRKLLFDGGEIPRLHKRPSNLIFMPHAGEDFHHILSGMRAMDETCRFLELKPGDRLGHGLAMGLDPTLWLNRVGRELAISRGEWLDDLVWFRRELLKLPDFSHIIHQIEEEALRLADEIYGHEDQRVTMRDLEHGHELRRYPVQLATAMPDNLPLPNIGLGFLQEPEPEWGHSLARRIWRIDVSAMKRVRRHNSEAHHIPLFKGIDKRNEIIRAFTPKEWDEAIRAVQNRWMAEFAAKGCVIEANPTSNLCISVMHEMEEHPIFRWAPIGKDPESRVVIGSDDPGVIATEIAFEFAVLIAVAKRRGNSFCEIEQWVDWLHRNSNELSYLED